MAFESLSSSIVSALRALNISLNETRMIELNIENMPDVNLNIVLNQEVIGSRIFPVES